MNILNESGFKLVSFTPDAEKAIERMGRICYKSEDKITNESAREFIKNIIKRGHESVIEHASASVIIICDRGITHELVRHRICSWSQESTRYCNYSKDKFGNELTFIKPPQIEEDSENYKLWHQAMETSEKIYLEMIANGVSPQIARSVLPNSLKAEIGMTANMREWRTIFKLRTSSAAHPQMREIMINILNTFTMLWPSIFEDITIG